MFCIMKYIVWAEKSFSFVCFFFDKNKPGCIALYNSERGRRGGVTGDVSTLFYKGIIIIEGICYTCFCGLLMMRMIMLMNGREDI